MVTLSQFTLLSTLLDNMFFKLPHRCANIQEDTSSKTIEKKKWVGIIFIMHRCAFRNGTHDASNQDIGMVTLNPVTIPSGKRFKAEGDSQQQGKPSCCLADVR